ncbi:hypothetical protein KJ973_00415 [Patescibacteria group bacterium]|nr:hypothetical protein [Patescibacteria group bacterium]MBU1246552.1 hypothetical protein [Patescibacteria group bacterium]MBU1519150.1 hypothetical protein [Patescibacteria group bacterium]MBU1730038.1 hypothetical protein [Patescibacteria group bacterium]MBU1956585.1 hypothetical protein [Patescibacteria group bacterium]
MNDQKFNNQINQDKKILANKKMRSKIIIISALLLVIFVFLSIVVGYFYFKGTGPKIGPKIGSIVRSIKGRIVKGRIVGLTLMWTYIPLYDSSFVDLDGDGKKEFLGATDYWGKNIVAYDLNRNMIWSHELFADGNTPYYVVDDLNGDGKKEIIGNGKDIKYSIYYPEKHLNVGKRDFTIFILDYLGNEKLNKRFDSDVYHSFYPLFADDLDGDGKKEIIFKKDAGYTSEGNYVSYIFIIDDKLNIIGNATIPKPHQYAELLIHAKDINGDSKKEIVCAFKFDSQTSDMIYPFEYFTNKGLIPLNLSELERNELMKDMKDIILPPLIWGPEKAKFNISIGNEKYLLNSTAEKKGGHGGLEDPFRYICGFEIYKSSGELQAVYTSPQEYVWPYPKIVVADLDNDKNDEIIWEDYKDYSTDEVYGFKVFTLK